MPPFGSEGSSHQGGPRARYWRRCATRLSLRDGAPATTVSPEGASAPSASAESWRSGAAPSLARKYNWASRTSRSGRSGADPHRFRVLYTIDGDTVLILHSRDGRRRRLGEFQ